MKNCYACSVELTESTASNEHVILNACGGYWQSKELLCIDCNSSFGAESDAVLAAQTNHCANLLGIVRQRGEPQKLKGKLKSTGEEYVIEASGRPMLNKPIVEESNVDGQPFLSIVARDAKELRTILKGYQKKYPGADLESLVRKATYTKEYLNEPLTFSMEVGGEKAFRSVVKTAINCYLLKGGAREHIEHLVPYLRGNETLKIVWMHYPEGTIYNYSSEAITHIIRIVGCPGESILYAYIELFNVYNYLVVLNEKYKGEVLDIAYAFDVFKLQEVQANVPIRYSRTQVLNFIRDTPSEYIQNFKNRFNWILAVAKQRGNRKHLNSLIDQACKEFFEKYPEGTELNESVIADISQIVASRIAPFLARLEHGL
jgi:hypothetical protein